MEKENKKKSKLGMLIGIGVVVVAIASTSVVMLKQNNIKKAQEAKKAYIEKIFSYRDRIGLEVPYMEVNSEEDYEQAKTKYNNYQELLNEVDDFLNETTAPDGCLELQRAAKLLVAQGTLTKNHIKDLIEINHEIDILLKNGKFDTLESQGNALKKMVELEKLTSGLSDRLDKLLESAKEVNNEYNKVKKSLEESDL